MSRCKLVREDCLREIRCSNCQQDHLSYASPCDVYKKEKEILEVKHRRNVSFQKTRKTGSYMRENTYASVARRVDPINQENKYRPLVEKLIHLEPNDWSKF